MRQRFVKIKLINANIYLWSGIYDNNTASENSDVSSKIEQGGGGRERVRSGLIKDFADKMTGNRDRGGSGSRVSRFSTVRHFHPRHELARHATEVSAFVRKRVRGRDETSAAQSSKNLSRPFKKRKKDLEARYEIGITVDSMNLES